MTQLVSQPGKLLAPVLAELGMKHEAHGSQAATVHDGDLRFNVTLRVERHFLMRVEVAEFTVVMKLKGEAGKIELGHRGKRGRTRIIARPDSDRSDLKVTSGRLEGSRALQHAFLDLDSKRATVEVGPGLSVGRIRHIGFSRVVMAFPPTRKYISAGPYQVEALINTLRELARFE